MKYKKVYAKESFKIKEYEIIIHDTFLEEQFLKSIGNNYIELAYNILTIISCNNKLRISSAINNIVNYYPKTTVDSEIKDNVLLSILQNKEVKRINFEKILLNLEYNFELNTSYHEFDDDLIFSDKINSIPYNNSIKSLKK